MNGTATIGLLVAPTLFVHSGLNETSLSGPSGDRSHGAVSVPDTQLYSSLYSATRLGGRVTSPPGITVSGHAADDEQGGAQSRFTSPDYPEALGFDLKRGWSDPWPHSHFSRRGTPYVHLFNIEPAFLDRDLFFDYRTVRGPDENEQELEVELEWAFSRRLGLVLEAPAVRLDPDVGSATSGLGDVALAPRVLLVDTDAFLLAGNLEASFPSGDDQRGLGSGEMGLAPSLSAWIDLGNWVQVSAQVGTESGLESGDSEVFYGGALAYSFLAPSLFGAASHTHAHGQFTHFPPGLTTTLVEVTGRTVTSGAEEGRDSAEVLFGLSHNVTDGWELRVGYQIPVGSPQDIDDAMVFSLIHHF